MIGLIVRRFFWTLPVLLVISVVTFGLMKAAPGGPWDRDAESKQIDPRIQKLLDQQFGLNKPLWRQFVAYNIGDFDNPDGSFRCGAVCGNLGPSTKQRGRMVQDILFKPFDEEKTFIESKFGYSLRLGSLALLFAVVVGIPLGVLSALKKNTWIDYVATFMTNIAISVPSFVTAFFAILVFAVWLGVTKVRQDYTTGEIWPWLMPAVVFGFGTMASMTRLTRAQMIEVMRQDYVRTARAKGAREQIVVWKHMLRNALIPVVTQLGPAFAGLITGSIVMEQVFSIPGVGVDFIRSIGNRDYSVIMGTTLFYSVLIVMGNLLVDILYGVVDPRMRAE